jgi:hypothetical protein
MVKLIAYHTWTCDRCSRKESTTPVIERRTIEYQRYPADWTRLDGKDLCPGCAKLVSEALRPTSIPVSASPVSTLQAGTSERIHSAGKPGLRSLWDAWDPHL